MIHNSRQPKTGSRDLKSADLPRVQINTLSLLYLIFYSTSVLLISRRFYLGPDTSRIHWTWVAVISIGFLFVFPYLLHLRLGMGTCPSTPGLLFLFARMRSLRFPLSYFVCVFEWWSNLSLVYTGDFGVVLRDSIDDGLMD